VRLNGLSRGGGIRFADSGPVLTIQKILVPVDFTETSERAIDLAVDMAAKLGASITLLHVYQIPIYGFPDATLITGPKLAAELSTAAQKALDHLYEKNKNRGVETTAILRDGVAWEEISATADQIGAHLIVIGTHGRRGLARALLGSVAENVIRTSHVPVLVVHGPREEKAKE
jgi:nucleotide-binding universal stress UspA family protein